MARNRIIYASQSVWVNGEVLYRVQSLGSSTTFTNEDIFELGHLDIVDVVDDVPAVAVTLNTNDFGDVHTFATLAQVAPAKRAMDANASISTGNLTVVESTGVTTGTYLHGACLADFAVTCGNLPGVTIWAPVQEECSLGTLSNNIDQTLFLDEVYMNSLEFSYTTGANATENYGAETDVKMWLLNEARFVNYDSVTVGAETSMVLTVTGTDTIATLSDGNLAFLRKDSDGAPSVTWYDDSLASVTNVPVVSGTATQTSDQFTYYHDGTTHYLYYPDTVDSVAVAAGDTMEVVYAANAYGAGTANTYFTLLDETHRPDMIGTVRQGQVEAYIVSPSDTEYAVAWRLTGVTISVDLTREPLAELGHLGPYDRPLTLPIPITVTADTTAGDLENWAKVAKKLTEFNANSLDDISLSDLMAVEDLKLVVMLYAQTDEDAGGTGASRTVASDSPLIDQNYWVDGSMSTYSAGGTEYPLKTVVVEHLKVTDEGMTLDMGANATQTFGFRSTNDLYVIKGSVSIANITNTGGVGTCRNIRRNA